MITQAFGLSRLIVFIINATGIALIITVFSGNLRKILKLIFILMTVFMFIWVDLAFLARVVEENNLGLLYIKLAWSVTPLLFVLVFCFITVFLRISDNYKYFSIFSIVLGFLFLAMIPLTGLVISDIQYVNGTLEILYGDFVWLFFGFVFVYTLINFSILIANLRKKDTSAEIKIRIKYLLIGLTIFFVANSIFNLAAPVFFSVFHLYEFGDYSLIIFLSIIAYAISTNRFARIEIVTATFLVSFLGSFLFLDMMLFSETFEQIASKAIISVLFIPFGYFLVSNVHKEIEQKKELEELNRKLKELDQIKNEFISVAAHELRAPLTAVKGYLSMILDGDAGTITDQTKDFLQDIQLSTERMIRLVNNMLDVGRIEEGRIVYNLEDINLAEIVNTAYNEFKLEAERKNLEFRLDVQSDLRDRVHVDRDRLHEVIVNFLSNATKYTETGGITMKLFNKGSKTVRLEVVDTGMGISKEEQKKLFRKFYRVKSKVGKTIGSGLGLYISKLLIEKFEGEIGVDSEPGKGSNFWFELPVSS